jgi:hypothetical protein
MRHLGTKLAQADRAAIVTTINDNDDSDEDRKKDIKVEFLLIFGCRIQNLLLDF